MAALTVGDKFPELLLESKEGEVSLAERWREQPLVVAFMRHFG
jgi:peroxiredoxin